MDSVVFTGGRPLSGISRYYHLGDVFATASTSETQGLTYYEAMAASRPVVAKMDPCINSTLIHGHNSLIFDDSAQLPELLHKALTDKAHTQALRLNALETIKPLSATRFGETVEELYQDILAQRRRGSLVSRALGKLRNLRNG
jgi:1,2-diacylglycerol 3-alpha-glucosyltransferase